MIIVLLYFTYITSRGLVLSAAPVSVQDWVMCVCVLLYFI